MVQQGMTSATYRSDSFMGYILSIFDCDFKIFERVDLLVVICVDKTHILLLGSVTESAASHRPITEFVIFALQVSMVFSDLAHERRT